MSRQRLSDAQLALLPSNIRRPQYDHAAQRSGIVHIGIGAFHRAHQAMYTDDAMAAGDRNWAITGVSLRSPAVRDALQPQNGLYSLVERDGSGERVRIVGAIRNVLVAGENPEAVIDALTSPDVHIVTFTVTEKGYLRDPSTGSLLCDAPDLARDLAGEGAPRTLYGFLERAFARRCAAGLPGMTLLSCDNLAGNGPQLAALLEEYLERRNPGIAAWARREIECPATMVDRIVPASTSADLERLTHLLGVEDRGAVFTEGFSQWVVEDRFAGPRPSWEAGGVQFTSDVRAFETAKLRMLNGAHSALAYVGLGLGFDYVHQAVADDDLHALLERLMTTEAAASLRPEPRQDLSQYSSTLLRRFENSSLAHRLVQIAMDGSQKIPQRWLASIVELSAQDKPRAALLFALAAWIAFVCTPGRVLDDPLARQLAAIRERAHGNASVAVEAIVGELGLYSSVWRADRVAVERIENHVAAITRTGMRAALQAWRSSVS